jgi:hypothetical protein
VNAGLVSVGEGEYGSRRSDRSWAERLRQTEVEHFVCAISPDLDVRRLEIAMDDAELVRGFECVGDLFGDRQRLGERYWPSCDARRQVLAVDELHDDRADGRLP